VTAPLVVVLDYGIGNLRSAQKALQKVGADARLTADPDVIGRADGVVLPGVGAFGACARALRGAGLDALARKAVEADVPFLAICIGMQLLYEASEEDPSEEGLGVLQGTVRPLPDGVKRPQMQWNELSVVGDPAPFAGLERPLWVYFVHSYAAEPGPDVVATCDYGGPVVAALERGRLWAAQFHPEKSGAAGLGLLGNFVHSL
jgi:glutamine amidotransferase